jgi:hypothetical protein
VADSAWDRHQLLTHFYPATENNDLKKNVFEKQPLKATVTSVGSGVARARLTCEMKMADSFYQQGRREIRGRRGRRLHGFEPGTRCIRALRLVTDKAAYNFGQFAVALRPVEYARHVPALTASRVLLTRDASFCHRVTMKPQLTIGYCGLKLRAAGRPFGGQIPGAEAAHRCAVIGPCEGRRL